MMRAPRMMKAPTPSAGPFGSSTPTPNAGEPEDGANNGLPAGVMPLPYDHPLQSLQRPIHSVLPSSHPLKPLQKMLRPDLPKAHPLRQMRMKLMGRMR